MWRNNENRYGWITIGLHWLVAITVIGLFALGLWSVDVTINTASLDSNHAERDKHLRGENFLDVKQFPEARFVSTGFKENNDGTAVLTGDFTLHGVTHPSAST